ncbi:IPT/TIG domain-containing protein [Curtobacterium sp. ME12]|uniref:IPT/TIG domain-containing protein n=1 Tax=Curtobacterium sp. ME12 TaxID=2744253 RepID=UPI0015F6B33C|nr:IPT/TIG domain-containing protein [Curtobacterium sp. ME12]
MQKPLVIAAALTAIALTVFGPAAAANASTVSNPGPPTSSFSPFGPYFTSVYGQTVTAPARSTALNAFSFQIESSGPMVVRGEVYAWDGRKATGPALFESDPLTLVGDSTAHVVSFRTGGTELVPGSEYVLFATLLRDVQPDSPDSSAWPTTGDVMPGQVVFLNARSFDQVTRTPWDAAPALDLMYTAEFEAAPTVRSVTPARGDIGGGSTITITGSDLSGTTAVTIGGHPATDVRVVSDGEVTATVPAGVAGTADVTVTTLRGTDTARGAYSYYAASAPSAPRDLTAVAGDAEVALRWAAPTDAGGSAVTGYAVQQRVDRSWRTVTTTSTTTATIAGLRNGTPTAFRVAAVTSAGTGTPTQAVSATPFVFTPIVTAGGRPLTAGRPLAAGDTLVVEDEALPAGATVSVGLDAAPTSIDTATVSSDGTVRLTGTVPAGTTIGDHTVVAALTLVDGTAGGATTTPLIVRAATVTPTPISPSAAPTTTPVIVDAAAPAAPAASSVGELATTGTDVTTAIEAALAFVTAGVGVLALTRRRRGRSGA